MLSHHDGPYISCLPHGAARSAAEHIQAAEHAHVVHADGAVNRTGVGAGHDLANETAVRPNGGARGSGGGPAGGGVLLVW